MARGRFITFLALAGITTVGCPKTQPAQPPEIDGAAIFATAGCAGCHVGGHAPDLSGWGTVARAVRFLESPDHYFGETRLAGLMEPTRMPAPQLERLGRWLLSAQPDDGPAARDWARAGCGDCHNDPRAMPGEAGWNEKPDGPDLRGYQSIAWTADLIADPTSRRFFGAPKHEGRAPCPPHPALGSEDLKALARWLLENGPAASQPRAP